MVERGVGSILGQFEDVFEPTTRIGNFILDNIDERRVERFRESLQRIMKLPGHDANLHVEPCLLLLFRQRQEDILGPLHLPGAEGFHKLLEDLEDLFNPAVLLPFILAQPCRKGGLQVGGAKQGEDFIDDHR